MLKLNVGISFSGQSFENELEKIRLGLKNNIDYISVISIDKDSIKPFWQKVVELFQAYKSANQENKTILCSAPLYESVIFNEDPIDTIARHSEYGVDAMTFHITSPELIRKADEISYPINSRGGQFIREWGKNLYYDNVREYIINAVINHNIKKIFLGTSLRPGACDKTAQIVLEELKSACQIYDWASCSFLKAEFEIEAFGHVPSYEWPVYKYVLDDRPLCVMGPLLTDSVNGYDDINSIIGYTLARNYGFKIKTACMISRSEHIKMPSIEDVEDEIKKWKVAEFTNDVVDGKYYAKKIEQEITAKKGNQRSQCSSHVNIFGAMDIQETSDVCGEHCPLKNEKANLLKN